MSCVLRLSAPEIQSRLAALNIKPYRVDRDTAHFTVSHCEFDDLQGQVHDAMKFLERHAAELRRVVAAGVDGSMDFAVHVPSQGFATRSFSPALVAAAGAIGLGLDLTAYPQDGEHAV